MSTSLGTGMCRPGARWPAFATALSLALLLPSGASAVELSATATSSQAATAEAEPYLPFAEDEIPGSEATRFELLGLAALFALAGAGLRHVANSGGAAR